MPIYKLSYFKSFILTFRTQQGWKYRSKCLCIAGVVVLISVFATKAFLGSLHVNTNGLSYGNCSQYHFGPTHADDLAKIETIYFPGIHQYMESLFPPLTRDPDPPRIPVFVTAFSSNHYDEGLYLLQNINGTVKAKYKDLRVIVYDLGLTEKEFKNLSEFCSCEVRIFPFYLYPKHVRYVQNYAWKPIIIQTVASQYPLLFWMDASVRFKTENLDNLINDITTNGLMVHDDMTYNPGMLSVGSITHGATFNSLNEQPCLYANQSIKHATFILIFSNQKITKYFLRPWVACALSQGCIDPIKNSTQYLRCPSERPHKYQLCHRYDQSVLSILYVRLFREEMEKHIIPTHYFMFCRQPGISPDCYLYE